MKSEIILEELGNLVEIKGGKRLPKGTKLSKEKTNHPYIRVKDMHGQKNLRITPDFEYVTEDVFNAIKKYTVSKNDIILSIVGTIGLVSKISESLDGANLTENCVKLINFKNIDEDYLYYYLSSEIGQHEIYKGIVGSTQPKLPIYNIKKVKVPMREIKEQKAIANILSTLDEKIETNNQINEKLEEMAQALFKHWFVDFEFPNENGEPYKSSGGEMVESELGMIPKGWEVSKLSELITLYNSKRIPLSKNERDKREKIYPYYGASSLMDYVDDYIFDGVYVLLGEDGTVIDELGYPILQYVWGKFWVNNHAHVIKGKNDYSEEFVYMLLKNTNVSSAVTGAVQLKINQKNLKNLSVVIPEDMDLIKQFSGILDYQFSIIRNNSDQNKVLTSIRDNLLPKLMSGEIRVPLDEEVLSEQN
ncbi:restriction endonuclease subunit S [Weizmannia sp. CD-2023]|uniref:Restriction endonuclease subunit S n=1 Tax=Heyndrickxia faecalis TaxID=2824910 RepID=A0AAU7WHJ7_9BACI|nr:MULTISPECIES: restriction endonuclease subunit S [Heyndrickxia]AWP38685.1 restriction endonuclease subunit S [Heyndrickxia coagulans]MEC2224105.1 restriction endonuclease subunit S [Weizmannia sp. CD-2023]MED4841287.1 restriction endonuclease subunit S [Weizmannia sp. CD-2023]MED4899671.1 restriction endonuclease subunit S [Weizmannia sp. CD-2023]QDI60991.1 restriction endonuclease subunit S [Heyndrickxia coagulans]